MGANVLIGQSGGPTAAINASLYGAYRAAVHNSAVDKIYGMVNGIEGFINGNYIDMQLEFLYKDASALKYTPAAYLGSCRYKLPDSMDDDIYPWLFSQFERLEIKYVLYIGGNDSMDTVDKLSRYAAAHGVEIYILGVPKTVDNDLVLTDHTPGYGCAAKYVATTVREIAMDAAVYYHPSVTLIEIMGRHSGWLTAASMAARKFNGDNPVLIYLPEQPFDLEKFRDDLKRQFERKNNLIVCVSEGIRDRDGRFICEYAREGSSDIFGHTNLAGCGKVLEEYVRRELGVKVRSVELNVSQRCSSTIGSLTDINESAAEGAFALSMAAQGQSGKMVAANRVGAGEYRLDYSLVDVSLVCNREKPFPTKWIIGNGADISPDFYDYLNPLIMGEPEITRKNGLPVFCYRDEQA